MLVLWTTFDSDSLRLIPGELSMVFRILIAVCKRVCLMGAQASVPA